MSQDKTIRAVSQGDENGVGKGFTKYVRWNKKQRGDEKYSAQHFNPIARKHTEFREKK